MTIPPKVLFVRAMLAADCPKCGADKEHPCERPDGESYRDTYVHQDRLVREDKHNTQE